MANLISQMEQALNELKLKEAKIKEDEERLKMEKEWVANNQLKTEKKIKLNVGGTYYTTTLTTLKSDPNSMLAAMFSGRFPIEKDEDDGAYFIDRNGRAFGHVLDWLRTGEISPELSSEDMFWLRKEAEYYQLESLKAFLEHLKQSPTTNEKSKGKHCILVPTYSEWMVARNNHNNSLKNQRRGVFSSLEKPEGLLTVSEDAFYNEEILKYLNEGYKLLQVSFPTTHVVNQRLLLVLE